MAVPATRQQLIDFCLRRLGEPVIEVNVDVDQIEDKVDDALQKYRDYHYDGTVRTFVKHLVTATDVTNEYITLSNDILYVNKVFPVSSTYATGGDLFDIRYQMMLNSMGDFIHFAGDLSYIYQMEQYLSLVDMTLHGTPQITFSRRQNRVYIHGDFADKDVKAGEYLIIECSQIIDPNIYTGIWGDTFMKDYTTALIKQQWGTNMSKFEGMQLPGGVQLNGRQILEDANADIEKVLENLRSEKELPVDFHIG
jgi:hypothetical protein